MALCSRQCAGPSSLLLSSPRRNQPSTGWQWHRQTAAPPPSPLPAPRWLAWRAAPAAPLAAAPWPPPAPPPWSSHQPRTPAPEGGRYIVFVILFRGTFLLRSVHEETPQLAPGRVAAVTVCKYCCWAVRWLSLRSFYSMQEKLLGSSNLLAGSDIKQKGQRMARQEARSGARLLLVRLSGRRQQPLSLGQRGLQRVALALRAPAAQYSRFKQRLPPGPVALRPGQLPLGDHG